MKKFTCTLCHKIMENVIKGKCDHCNSPARTRMLPVILEKINDKILKDLAQSKPLLGFAMTRMEKSELSKIFSSFTSASLYGNYGKDHIEGCDVRDLSRFSDDSFCGVFSSLLFDYFTEIEQALKECARVTAPGGIFITHIAKGRLSDGDAPVTVGSIIQKTETYFQYIPDDANMPSIKLGRQTFLKAMQNAGYTAEHYSLEDEASGEITDWFIGIVPQK